MSCLMNTKTYSSTKSTNEAGICASEDHCTYVMLGVHFQTVHHIGKGVILTVEMD